MYPLFSNAVFRHTTHAIWLGFCALRSANKTSHWK